MTEPVRYQAFPQLDVGNHAGCIVQLLATRDGRRIVSAGETTIRVWNADERRLERLLLGQVNGATDDAAIDGKAQRIAASVDGRWLVALKPWRQRTLAADEPAVAAGGHDAGWVTEVQVFELASGNLRSRFVHPGQLLDLDFSPDGRWLALLANARVGRLRQAEVSLVALRDLLRRGANAPPPAQARLAVGAMRRGAAPQAALRFVPAAVPSRRGAAALAVAIGDPAARRSRLAWLGFSPGSGLVLQRTAATAEPIAPDTLTASATLAAVAALPGGGRKLRGKLFWLAHDGTLSGTVETEAPPASMAFSPSGRQLAVGLMVDSAGGVDAPSGAQTVQVSAFAVLPEGGLALRSSYFGHDGSVWALAWRDDATLVSAGGDNQAIHFWSPARRIAEPIAAIRGVGRVAYEPGITADERVLFGSVPLRLLPPGHAKRQQSFDLRRMQLSTTAASDVRWDDFVSRKWWVAFDDGPVIPLRFRGDSDEATPDREPDLNLFVGADDEWVIWSRSGYYDAASPQAARRIGYRVNRGPAQEALLVPSDRFKAFYRPDIIRAIVKHGSEERARARGVAIPALPVAHVLPPIVELAPGGVRQADGRVGFVVTVESPCPAYLPTRLSLLRNGRVVWVEREPPQRPLARCVVPAMPLLPGSNRFAIHAENAHAKSVPHEIEISGPPPGSAAAADLAAPGQLFLLAVGVSEYADPGTRPLRFPHLDAQAVFDAFGHGRLASRTATGPGNRAFEAVDARLLVNAEATKAAILDELDRMCARIHERHAEAGAERDVLFVFLSGHGVRVIENGSPSLFFQNHDMVPTAEQVDATGLSMLDLGDRITSVPAEVVLVIDACRAALAGRGVVAGLDPEELARRVHAIHERGMYLVSAAQADELAREDASSRLGVLTAAVLSALRQARPAGGAARGRRGLEVLMAELVAGVQRLVPEFTARAGARPQTPVCRIYGDLVPLTILRT